MGHCLSQIRFIDQRNGIFTAGAQPYDLLVLFIQGLDRLAELVQGMFSGTMPCDGSILTNARQADAIRRAYDAMLSALDGLSLGLTPDAVLTDVEEAMAATASAQGLVVAELSR